MLLRGKRLMEELLSTLTKVKSLRVSARTLAFAFKDKKEDIRKIGQLLNVDHVVQRSVRKAGNTLRITVQLIKVSDGFHRWSQAYGRAMKMHAILQIQSELPNGWLPHHVCDAPHSASSRPCNSSHHPFGDVTVRVNSSV